MEQQILAIDPTGQRRGAEEIELRAHGPAAQVDVLGVKAWAIADPAVLKVLLADPRVSKDAHQHWPMYPDQVVGTWPLASWVGVTNMGTAHGARHRRLRRLVSPAFTTRRISALAPRIEQIAEALLDDLAATPPGEQVDLRSRYADPLPIQVISELMGLPTWAQPDFRRAVDRLFDTTLTQEQATANAEQLRRVISDLVAAKQANPTDDMTSVLIAAHDVEGDGMALTERELLDTLFLIISAGYQTTVNLLDQAVAALLHNPDQLAHVRVGHAGWGDVVEEALRYETPVAYLPMRYAVEDIELPDGMTIRQGEAILPCYAAAGRHPNLHGPTADAFVVTREVKEHFAFGHGIHFCMGAPLARLEAEIALRKLFERFPDIAFAPGTRLRKQESFITNAHQELPVVLRQSPRR